MPQQCGKYIIVPAYTKDGRTDCDDYHVVALLPTAHYVTKFMQHFLSGTFVLSSSLRFITWIISPGIFKINFPTRVHDLDTRVLSHVMSRIKTIESDPSAHTNTVMYEQMQFLFRVVR